MTIKLSREERIEKMTNDRVKEKLFELIFAMDDLSAKKDFVGLRSKHYSNQTWLHDMGLGEEYYNYFLEKIRSIKN